MTDDDGLKRQVLDFIEQNQSRLNRTNQNQSILGSPDAVKPEDKPQSKFVVFKKSVSEELNFPAEEDEVLRIKSELGANLLKNRRGGKGSSGKVSSFTRVGSNPSHSEASGSQNPEKESPTKRNDSQE